MEARRATAGGGESNGHNGNGTSHTATTNGSGENNGHSGNGTSHTNGKPHVSTKAIDSSNEGIKAF